MFKKLLYFSFFCIFFAIHIVIASDGEATARPVDYNQQALFCMEGDQMEILGQVRQYDLPIMVFYQGPAHLEHSDESLIVQLRDKIEAGEIDLREHTLAYFDLIPLLLSVLTQALDQCVQARLSIFHMLKFMVHDQLMNQEIADIIGSALFTQRAESHAFRSAIIRLARITPESLRQSFIFIGAPTIIFTTRLVTGFPGMSQDERGVVKPISQINQGTFLVKHVELDCIPRILRGEQAFVPYREE